MNSYNRNRISKSLLAIVMIGAMLAWQSCGGDDPASGEQDLMTNKLTANVWQVSSVTVDGDESELFDDMTLTFAATTYATTNGAAVWPATGSWMFASDDGKRIVRDDGLEITIIDITESKLRLSFMWTSTTLGPGRVGGLAGAHDFTFVRK